MKHVTHDLMRVPNGFNLTAMAKTLCYNFSAQNIKKKWNNFYKNLYFIPWFFIKYSYLVLNDFVVFILLRCPIQMGMYIYV